MAETSNTSDLSSSNIIEYIKVQWQDIHHSRLQEYTVFGLAAGIFYALNKENDDIEKLKPFIAGLGLFFSIVGLLISWNHFLIFREKIQVIREMERKIGINYPTRFVWLPVQTLIFWLFGGVSGTFLGMIIYSVSKDIGLSLFFAFFTILMCLVFILVKRKTQKPKNLTLYNFPYFIENKDIESCLKSLNGIPLKLVVDDLLTRQGIEEKLWVNPKWEYEVKNDKIIKPAFVTPKDIFQFSVADANSKQDWHFHKFVFEVYLSDKPIEIEYMEQKSTTIRSSIVQNGVLIVPPSLKHKVTLSGTTYVFQATLSKGGGINQDKNLVNINT